MTNVLGCTQLNPPHTEGALYAYKSPKWPLPQFLLPLDDNWGWRSSGVCCFNDLVLVTEINGESLDGASLMAVAAGNWVDFLNNWKRA